MARTSSTSSSSRVPGGALLALAVIVAIELWLGRVGPADLQAHWVDELLHSIDQSSGEQNRMAVVGDSVANQLMHHRPISGMASVVPLVANAGIEMAGYCYVIERYVRNNAPPDAVLIISRNPFLMNLDTIYTENYVQRCFLRWKEVGELTWRKRSPAFGLTMLGYKLCPSFRYRRALHHIILRKEEESSGKGWAPPVQATPKRKRPDVFEAFIGWLLPTRNLEISEEYFEQLARLVGSWGGKLYYLHSPMRESGLADFTEGPNRLRLLSYLRHSERLYPQCVLIEDLARFPDKDFGDGFHFNRVSVRKVAAQVAPLMESMRDGTFRKEDWIIGPEPEAGGPAIRKREPGEARRK